MSMYACPPGPIEPIGMPTKGGNVILQFYFKKTDTWPKVLSVDGKQELSHAQIIDRFVYICCWFVRN